MLLESCHPLIRPLHCTFIRFKSTDMCLPVDWLWAIFSCDRLVPLQCLGCVNGKIKHFSHANLNSRPGPRKLPLVGVLRKWRLGCQAAAAGSGLEESCTGWSWCWSQGVLLKKLGYETAERHSWGFIPAVRMRKSWCQVIYRSMFGLELALNTLILFLKFYFPDYELRISASLWSLCVKRPQICGSVSWQFHESDSDGTPGRAVI